MYCKLKVDDKKYLPSTWIENRIDMNLSYLDNLAIQIVKYAQAKEMKRIASTNSNEFLSAYRLKMTNKLLVESILNFVTIRKSKEGMILFTNPDNIRLVSNDKSILKRIIRSIEKYSEINVTFKSDGIEKISRNIYDSLIHDKSIPQLNLIPNHIILLSNDLLFNTKTRKYEDQDNFTKFDLTYQCEWSYLDENAIKSFNKDLSQKYKVYYELSKRILNGWCSKDNDLQEIDNDKRIQLMQIQIAAIQGNSRNKYVELLGSGGNGKSSLLNVIKSLIGSSNTIELDLSQIADDNMLGLISSNTRAIIGHEISTDFRFSVMTTPRYKQLAMSDPININEKYMMPRIIKFDGIGIQACNTLMTFPENTPAINDRRFPIVMSEINFRNRLDLKINIDKYMSEEFFRSVYATMLFNECNDFDDFLITDDTKACINELAKAGDNLASFIDDEFDKFNFIRYLSTTMLYQVYCNWCDDVGLSKMSKIKFIKKIESHLKEKTYLLSDASDKKHFNIDVLTYNTLYKYVYQVTRCDKHRSRYFYKVDDYIDELSIKKFIEEMKLDNSRDLTDKEMIMLHWLMLVSDKVDSESLMIQQLAELKGLI